MLLSLIHHWTVTLSCVRSWTRPNRHIDRIIHHETLQVHSAGDHRLDPNLSAWLGDWTTTELPRRVRLCLILWIISFMSKAYSRSARCPYSCFQWTFSLCAEIRWTLLNFVVTGNRVGCGCKATSIGRNWKSASGLATGQRSRVYWRVLMTWA